jgi:DNA-binding MarR family transcriptional regulator
MNNNESTAAQIADTCVCLGLRKSARMIARRYDAGLRDLGITSGQFSIMAALLHDQPVGMGKIADVLGLERTTLTRNLKPLCAAGLIIEAHVAEDGRVREYALTDTGRALLARALVVWQRLQTENLSRLGQPGWPGLKQQLTALA